MAYEIIMPVLGMSQDTGIIASWCKSPGDYVSAGEAIMEVETDKAIQEIEAAESGYLSQVFYPQDAKVPVGEVVGLLTAEKPEDLDEVTASAPATADAEKAAEAENTDAAPDASAAPVSAAPATTAATAPANTGTDNQSAATQTTPQGGVLASGKARAAARQHQLSLEAVSAALGKRPLHAADISAYLELPAAGTHAASAANSLHPAAAMGTQMAFRVSRSGLKHCERWLSGQQSEGAEISSSHLIATLASGLWREMVVADSTASVIIDVESAGADGFSQSQLQDADLQRFSRLETVPEADRAQAADLQLVDLRHSTLCDYYPGALAQPLLVVAKDRKAIKVSLYGISAAQNIAGLRFMDTLARQLEEPLVYIA